MTVKYAFPIKANPGKPGDAKLRVYWSASFYDRRVPKNGTPNDSRATEGLPGFLLCDLEHDTSSDD